jgi:hypothetical protein
MGSHGHGTLTNLVMGSVATKVLAHCKTPVLLVRCGTVAAPVSGVGSTPPSAGAAAGTGPARP